MAMIIDEKQVIKEQGGYALVRWTRQWEGGQFTELVVWYKSPNGGYVWGHYFKDDEEGMKLALEDLEKRTSK